MAQRSPKAPEPYRWGWKVVDAAGRSPFAPKNGKVEYRPGEPTFPREDCGPLTVFWEFADAEIWRRQMLESNIVADFDVAPLLSVRLCLFRPAREVRLWVDGYSYMRTVESLPKGGQLADEVIIDPPGYAFGPTGCEKLGWGWRPGYKVVYIRPDGGMESAFARSILGRAVEYDYGKITSREPWGGPLAVFRDDRPAYVFRDHAAYNEGGFYRIMPCLYYPSSSTVLWAYDRHGNKVQNQVVPVGTDWADKVFIFKRPRIRKEKK